MEARSVDDRIKARAIVSYAPANGEAQFRMEDVILRETQGDELLIEMVASGICSTDLFFASSPAGTLGPFPRVLGHEGNLYLFLQYFGMITRV